MLFGKEGNCHGAILRGNGLENSGDFDVDSGLGRRVFGFANDGSGLVFDSEVWERVVVLRAYNASDSCERVVVRIGVSQEFGNQHGMVLFLVEQLIEIRRVVR